MFALGFDIGGSSIKAVAAENKKIIASKIEVLPKSFQGFLKVAKEMKNALEKELKKKAEGAGFSFPGPIDKKREKIIACPNIPYLANKSILKILKKELQISSIKIEHDIHCFLLAEREFGVSKKYQNVFYLAIGTGLGGAFSIDGKIVRGFHGSAGEFGQMIFNLERKETLEDICSGKYIVKKLGIDVSTAITEAEKGNGKVQKVFSELGYNLGVGVAGVINILDPEVVFISGGISTARKFFDLEMRRAIQTFVVSKKAKKTKIIFSKLGRFGGAMGAGLMAVES